MLMPNKEESIEALLEKRTRWVEANLENGFEEGINRLLSDLYPDQAHFIYELLQNAEDAEASVVKFELKQRCLLVTHNGKILFNYKDVNSITSIGDSTKSEDINAIGKFGVGFKAVFGYTNAPQIHSGPYNFEIRDLVCPFKIESINKSDAETIFIFPFNKPEKDNKDCFDEVDSFFRHIDSSILLFLGSIKSIEWSVEGGERGVIRRTVRDDIDPNLIQISIKKSGADVREKDAWFLCFQRKHPEHGDLMKCGVALKLEFRKSIIRKLIKDEKLSEQMKVTRDTGKLCIFFPADKETTGLKFHINGPYASTIDRASIRHNDPGNISLLSHTIDLFSEVLEKLKDKGMLTADFLTVLPNDEDDLNYFYDTFRQSIYKTLKEQDLVPTHDGGFAKAGELIRGSKNFTDFFSNQDISALSGEENRQWAVNVMSNFRTDKLFKSLDIPVWGNDELANSIEKKFSTHWSFGSSSCDSDAYKWLAAKSINWIREFYFLLWNAVGKDSSDLIYLKIILTEDNQLVRGNEAYFPPDEDSTDYGLLVVKKVLFENLRSEKRERLKSILSASGVSHIGEKEEIENILKKYYGENSRKLSIKRHKKHIKRFISWTQQNHSYNLFTPYSIFFDSQNTLHKAGSFFLDQPFSRTGLSALQEYTGQIALWNGYKPIKDFENFAKRIGVVSKLEIYQIPITRNHPESDILFRHIGERWTNRKINRDYTIENLDELLKTPSKTLSQLIWSTMCSANSLVLEACFRPNAQYHTQKTKSSLVHALLSAMWIPTKEGRFSSPRAMTVENLPDEFIYNNTNGWLTAIGFGKEETQATEEYQEKLQNANQLGLDIEDIELIKAHREDFLKWKESQKSKQAASNFPSKTSKNLDHRKKKVSGKLKTAPPKTYDPKSRSVRTSRNNIDPAAWLVTQYTNDEGDMFCQLCQQDLNSSSFKKRNGDLYFETVEVFRREKLDIEHEAVWLALCPLCAARYKEFIKRDENAAEKLLNEFVEPDNLKISLQIGEEQAVLRFVGTHYSDLRVVLWGEEDV